MPAPTSIAVTVDLEEYSRFEYDRKDVLVTLDVVGTGLLNEDITVELRKARRDRSEVVQTKTVTLANNVSHLTQVTIDLAEVIDSSAAPRVRRGHYFVRATSVTDPLITGDSSDFRVSLITVERLRDDYLHGTDQFSSDQLTVLDQPSVLPVTVTSVSRGHPQSAFPLSYNYAIAAVPTITGTTTETFALVDGQTLVLRVDGSAALTATFNTADFGNIAAATAAEVAAVITADIPQVVASDATGAVKIDGILLDGTQSIVVDPAGTATATLGMTGLSSTATVTRLLSWCNGPTVPLVSGTTTYTLQRGPGTPDWIKVRVPSLASFPQQSRAEELIIDRKPLDEERIRAIIEQAISWVEDVELSVYLEPTRVTTTVDANTLVIPTGEDNPQLQGADWDCVVDALHYQKPSAGHWIGFKMPYYPVIEFEELYGSVSNTRIIDIALEWVEVHEKTGWVELVPFNQEVAFNYIGLIWVESLRGPVPLPNFWNFTAMVGFRKTPEILLELVAKKAAMDILTIAGQAFRGGFASQSISRDGVSESVSYTASATFGIYSATIEDYRKWIEKTLKHLRGAFRGPNMVVM